MIYITKSQHPQHYACSNCGGKSATFYTVSIGSSREVICPTCLAIIRRDLEQIDKLYEGY